MVAQLVEVHRAPADLAFLLTGNSAFDSKYRSGEAPATAQRSPSVPSPSSPLLPHLRNANTNAKRGLDSITGRQLALLPLAF